MRLVWYRDGWAAYWRDEASRPRRVSLRTQDREDAERLLIDLERSVEPAATTVGAIFEQYQRDKSTTPQGVRAGFAWLKLEPVFGFLRPDQVDRARCRAYVNQRRRKGASDGTIIKELSILRASLRWSDKSTAAIVELPPAPPPKSRHLSREQYRALRDAAQQTPHLYMFVVTAYSTAGRASAVLDLTWDRVEFDAGRIRLGLGEKRSKGRATVPMTDGVRAALLEAKEGSLSNYVVEFAGRKVDSVKRAFAAAAKRAGVPWCTPHVLRHTAAVHMVESGVPIEQVAQYLGHSSVAVTYRVYARFSPEFLRGAAAALE